MLKNKKGFTLVELLAVIIILIIILLIAINKVKDASQKSHMNAIKASTLSYKKVVQSKFSEEGLINEEEDTGFFYVKDLDIKVDGKKPTGGFFIIEDSKIFYYCLEYENSYHAEEDENGNVNVTDGLCKFKSYEYSYRGSYGEFSAPKSGYYLIEAWGAQGANYSTTSGGKGAYTSGIIKLDVGDTLYIYVGGSSTNKTGGYNGGANGGSSTDGTYNGGGGASDIRLVSGDWNDSESLASRIMVAGGGAGSGYYWVGPMSGGDAGGLVGLSGTQNGKGTPHTVASGGTQRSSGLGVDKAPTVSGFGFAYQANSYGTGGGSGYYGGGSGGSTNSQVSAGAGGSSYISGYAGCVAITSSTNLSPKQVCSLEGETYDCSVHYSNKAFIIPIMKAGNEEMPTHDGKSTMVGNTGNGYVKISLVKLTNSSSASGATVNFAYNGSEETFDITQTGTYKLEVWGAQGGGSIMNGSSSSTTSYGGYSVGYVDLNSGDTLYINVGGKGQNAVNGANSTGGYNGGGDGTWDRADNEAAGAGGGATHIATKSGLLSSLSGNNDKILIVAGGGGGKSWNTDGGNGGGYIGGAAGDGRKANQTTGYSFGKGENATGVGDSDGHGGGGGGYWGGYESSTSGASNDFGGGGSGYIGNPSLTNKTMYCYNCTESSDEAIKTISTTCVNSKATENCAKSGDGYAKITFMN